MRGHLIKRSKDSWSIVLDIGRDPVTGKRRQQWTTVRGTKREAERKLTGIQNKIDMGLFVKPSKLTIGEFLQDWLSSYVTTNVRAATAEGYRIIVERHLTPALGKLIMSELKPSHLRAYYTKALENGRTDGRGGLSARTVIHHHRVLREALSHAVKWELTGRNVADAVVPPRSVAKEMGSLDSAGVRQLLTAASGTLYFPLIHLAAYTGMRRSEILGLRWKDVDLHMMTVSVAQVLHCLPGGRIVFEQPKTSRSKRLVGLSPEAALALRAHQEVVEADQEQLGSQITGERLVFSQPDGSPMLPNTVTHAFAKIARRAGLTGITFHSLRHSHASIMLQQGVSSKTVADRLGHSTVVITLDTYSHVTPGIKEDAAMRFEEAIRETNFPARE